MTADASNGAVAPSPKRCFVVSEFGVDDKTRLARDQTLKHLVKKVLEPMGYEVQRADDIDDLGQITHQIIERLLDDDLVVADLTGLNPNVFYELAVRHAVRKPVITLMTFGEEIPFDLKDVRTVFYELSDPDKLANAQQELAQKIKAIESNTGEIRNPITVARNVTLLQQSDDPEVQATGEILSAISDLRDELRAVVRVVTPNLHVGGSSAMQTQLNYMMGTGRLLDRTTEDIAAELSADPAEVRAYLAGVSFAGRKVHYVDGVWRGRSS
jgi:hypothetical protein